MQETKLPEAQDLMELVRKSIDDGVSIGGYVMRWSFLDQSLLSHGPETPHPILQSIEDELEDTPFHLDFRAINDGVVMIPQFDVVWEGGMETVEQTMFPMRARIQELLGELPSLSHILFLPPEFRYNMEEE
ncbi:MAG: hypothetical protein CL833_09775 [Crocinitomicaceae bacterium]|nr:hypothetical protein [Crocinitomicaceae bacterium]